MKSKIIYFAICLCLLIIGVWRYQVLKSRMENSEYNGLEEEIVLTGIVVKEPDVRETNTKLTIKPCGGQASARLLVTVGRYPEYKYGDELKIMGKLQVPVVFDDFNYKDYLFNQGIVAVIYYPQVAIIARGQASDFYSRILDFKDKLRNSIYTSLSPPQSSILGAMILGDKNRMSSQLKEKLNIAGIRHITAVSGMHILILSGILMSLLLGLGFWKNQAFYISITVLFLFIAMTGFQPSGIRAGIMGGLFLFAQKLGRKSISYWTILLAGTLMFVLNPLLIKDAGFQLSFLAVIGIISLHSYFKYMLRFLPKKFLQLKIIIATTLSAYIFTLPILIYNFGRVSLVGVLTNILVIPVIYWIMILGLIFVLIGLFWQGLALILSFPVWFLLTYIIKITDLFSQPWAAKTINNVHWIWLILSYLFLFIIIRYFKNKKYGVQ